MLAAWFAYLKSWLKQCCLTTILFIYDTFFYIKYFFRPLDYAAHVVGRKRMILEARFRDWMRNRRRQRKCWHAVYQLHLNPKPKPQRSTTNSRCHAYAMTMLIAYSAAELDRMSRASIRFDSDGDLVGMDNRASACISDRKTDFKPGTLRPCGRVIKGFGGHIFRDVMVGVLVWRVEDDKGRTHVFEIPGSFYVPQGGVRLFSPQHFAKTRNDHHPRPNGTQLITRDDFMILQWNQRKYTLTCPIDPAINVASFHLAPGYTAFEAFEQAADLQDDLDPICMPVHLIPPDDDDGDDVVQDSPSPLDSGDPGSPFFLTPDAEPTTRPEGTPVVVPFDLSSTEDASEYTVQPDEEELLKAPIAARLLRFHHRYNHISFAKLKHMARRGIIPKELANCDVPMCSACLYGKATKRPWRTKAQKKLKRALNPGDVVSVDQMTSPTAGLIAQMAGFLTKKRYKYATVFVDHASGFGYVYIQKTASAEETLEAKAAFEKMAATHGVKIKHYHADNGVFAAKAWRDACAGQGQGLTFAGVNAHFQNARAERRIRELQELARSSLIHANRRWPNAIDAHLWPYAIRLASDAYNEAMGRDGSPSPLEKFSKSPVEPNSRFWQPFGCPCYVLDAALQSDKAIKHKWEERSRVGIYLGRSPQHARSVALVLNLETGHVSPQFHVVFDPSFQTIKCSFGGQPPVSHWQAKCGFTNEVAEQPSPPPPARVSEGTRRQEALATQPTARRGAMHRVQFQEPTDALDDDQVEQPDQPPTPAAVDEQDPLPEDDQPQPDLRVQRQTYQETPQEPTATTRSGRVVRAPQRLLAAMLSLLMLSTTVAEGVPSQVQGASALSTNSTDLSKDFTPVPGELFCYEALFPEDEVLEDTHPLLAYGATNDPDVLYYHEAMRAPDADKFEVARDKEFNDQWKNDNFEIIRKDDVPVGAKVLPCVWAMRRKRRTLTGEVYKWKARLNLDGSKQIADDFKKHPDDFWQTYSPVASWPTIRLMLTLCLIHNWHTMQLDFVQAYPQAPISKVQYMAWPKGIEIPGYDPSEHVLKVTKNIYGGKDAGRTWNEYLVNKLTNHVGFTQSKYDPCLFYKGSAVYVLYTDDSILAGPDKQELEEIVEDMKSTGLDLTCEGDLTDFLGVAIHRDNKAGTFELTQQRLIDGILDELRLGAPNATTKDTPAKTSVILKRHTDSEPFDGHFHYRRIIGKLNFLEKSTRADLAYPVHQCARFSINPKVEHGQAVKWIGRYLKGTSDKGYIMKPDMSHGLEVYVDADFAGNWDKEGAGVDRDTARSRHGYFIRYAGVPIMWLSQLQTEIAMSSTEAELVGMSMALRTVIPIQGILREMQDAGYGVHPDPRAAFKCKLFEDNQSALDIAQVPKVRPRTKHINCKYFHFTTHVLNGQITLHKIKSEDQPADFLTKMLDELTFIKHRFFVLGW